MKIEKWYIESDKVMLYENHLQDKNLITKNNSQIEIKYN